MQTSMPGQHMQLEHAYGSRDPAPHEVPHAFLCPISHGIMTDPVVAADGHSCELLKSCLICPEIIICLMGHAGSYRRKRYHVRGFPDPGRMGLWG